MPRRLLTVGVFDGVHIGHQALLRQLRHAAAERGLTPAVATFDAHPRRVLSKGNDNVRLLTLPLEREALLREAGIECLVTIPFTRKLSDLTAADFLRLWVKDELEADALLMGYNHHFGSDLLTASEYDAAGREAGVEILHGSPTLLPDGRKVSSSDCRRLLEAGLVADARLMLGRPYRLTGTVVAGNGIGRSLGFPTANLDICPDKLLPLAGVYAAQVAHTSGGSTTTLNCQAQQLAVVNIGTRPTFGQGPTRVEAHLLDFHGALYGAQLSLDLTELLRPEQRFNTPELLARQIERDVAITRKIDEQG